jgi:alkanesulfonate monooxygenase SsuD/methylene tetrahydromethanopterin reductase-like flavin-dependent oxidoreductase (luciferase family)
VNFGCQVVAYGDVAGAIEDAVRAERAGFDVVTVPDHLFHPTDSDEFLVDPPWEAFSVLGAIAQHTEAVQLMPGVTDSVRRHPTELAHVGATLDRMTGGRFGLGIGAGEAFNLAPIEDDGAFYEIEDAVMELEPVQQPRPPMWVGGYGESMRGFTGALADGWFPWIHTPDQYEADLQDVLSVARNRGRDPERIDRAVMVPTAVAEDGDEAREAAVERNRTTLALRPPLLAKMGYEDVAEETPIMFEMAFDEEQERRLLAAADRIPDEAVAEITVAGTPEEVIEDVERWIRAGVDNLVVIPVGDFEETMTHYEETVIPYFRE